MFNQFAWSHFFSELSQKFQTIYQLCLAKASKQNDSDWAPVLEMVQDIFQKVCFDPGQHFQSAMSYSQNNMNLFQNLSFGQNFSDSLSDKRFKDQLWQEHPIYSGLQQHYLIFCQKMEQMADQIQGLEAGIEKKLRFLIKQITHALSPGHFPVTNPRVFKQLLDSQGANILKGLDHLIQDLEQQSDSFQIPITDLEAFSLGENIAATPGAVIYQNDLMQLIQYEAKTEKVYEKPLLIIPPWINKYYVLDLSHDNSWVNWLLKKGYTVFMISWVNPNKSHAHKNFEDYLLEGPIAALSEIEKITGQVGVNAVGYCIGGTLLACALSYLSYHKQCHRIISGTYLTTLLDFSEPGDLGIFMDEKQISHLEEKIKKTGYLDGKTMANLFNILKANDLIWSSYIKRYLSGEKLSALDILFWNADSTHLPAAMQRFYLRSMYLDNQLIQPGTMKLAGTPIHLQSIQNPVYFLATEQDHIVPWESAYKGIHLHSGPTTFVLGGSGHIAGVVNPPHKQKYYYYTQTRKHKSAKLFKKHARFHQGSWWENWAYWVREYSGKLINPLALNKANCIEKAPGTYVKVRI
jgi:polyhydroxyalkanoate synthase subunit PhaC